MPARLCSNSPVRCVRRPGPLVPYAISPGRRLASAIRSDHAEGRCGRHEHRRAAEEADRNEVARDLDREVRSRPWNRHEGRQRWNGERVSVGCGARRAARRDGAAAARLIDRQHLLAPDPCQAVGDHPQDDINGAARRRVGDDAHGPVGVVLGARRWRSVEHGCKSEKNGEVAPAQQSGHGAPQQNLGACVARAKNKDTLR